MDGQGGSSLSVSVTICETGFDFQLSLVDRYDHQAFYRTESRGIPILVEKKSRIYVEGTTIDWVKTDKGQEGFHFENPNAISSCE